MRRRSGRPCSASPPNRPDQRQQGPESGVMTGRGKPCRVPIRGDAAGPSRTKEAMQNPRRLGAIAARRPLFRLLGFAALAALLAASMMAYWPARAESPSLDGLLSAVVHLKTTINPDGRTVDSLG